MALISEYSNWHYFYYLEYAAPLIVVATGTVLYVRERFGYCRMVVIASLASLAAYIILNNMDGLIFPYDVLVAEPFTQGFQLACFAGMPFAVVDWLRRRAQAPARS